MVFFYSISVYNSVFFIFQWFTFDLDLLGEWDHICESTLRSTFVMLQNLVLELLQYAYVYYVLTCIFDLVICHLCYMSIWLIDFMHDIGIAWHDGIWECQLIAWLYILWFNIYYLWFTWVVKTVVLEILVTTCRDIDFGRLLV